MINIIKRVEKFSSGEGTRTPDLLGYEPGELPTATTPQYKKLSGYLSGDQTQNIVTIIHLR
jgi:hypothetical protein